MNKAVAKALIIDFAIFAVFLLFGWNYLATFWGGVITESVFAQFDEARKGGRLD